MNKKGFFFLLFLLTLIRVNAQIEARIPFFVGNAIQSKGNIPDLFTEELYSDYWSFKDSIKNSGIENTNFRLDFYLQSETTLKGIISSGKVLYGDIITQYLNKVMSKILKASNIKGERISVYTLKSTSMNAISTQQGVIFINIGLISRLTNEDEIAFVIAHELAHYLKNDPVNSYIFDSELIKKENGFRKVNQETIFQNIAERSRSLEIAADSVGCELAIKAGYNPQYILSALDKLKYANQPVEQIKFEIDFFNTKDFIIPKCFFLDETAEMDTTEISQDLYDDHPNISIRKNCVSRIISNHTFSTIKDESSETNEFLNIRKYSQFELIRLQLLNNNFAEAIFNSFVLLKQQPDNPELKLYIAKALFALAEFKCDDSFFKVAEAYNSISGQAQQIHYLIKQLTKRQLNTLALKYVNELKSELSNNLLINVLETQLMLNMIVNCNAEITDFNAEYIKYDTTIAENNLHTRKREILELQKLNGGFYKNAFIHQLQDSDFIQKYQNIKQGISINSELSKEVGNNKPASYTPKNSSATSHFNSTEVILLNPRFYNLSANQNINRIKLKEKNQLFTSNLIEAINKEKLPYLLFDLHQIPHSKLFDYNDYCKMTELFQEIYFSSVHYPLSLGTEIDLDQDRIFCDINVFNFDNGEDKIIVAFYKIRNRNITFLYKEYIDNHLLKKVTDQITQDLIKIY